MTEPGDADVEDAVHIDADAHAVYRMITDLGTLAALAEEITAMEWVKGDTARRGAARSSRAATATGGGAGRPPARSPTPIPAGCLRSTCAARLSQWPIGATTSRLPMTAAAASPSAPGDRKAANVEHIARTLARLKHQAEAAPGPTT
jgi:hypothetical protein